MVGRKTKSDLARRSGYLLLPIIALLWPVRGVDPGIIAILSTGVVLYCLFQAPTWCCATTRKGQFCRNNANGILLGCRLRQHKWQKPKMAFREQALSEAGRRMLSDLSGKAASLSAIAGTVSAGAATVTLLVK
ncbi:hypothetical protein [Amycolatopsis panacis]|uniref:hypothetical protein n=1 Tax=Amycolatopsis panacis TaxID=2340917 RepID=UPI001F30D1FD|nr:hypothetical protein [Amycolatopsis panacis]